MLLGKCGEWAKSEKKENWKFSSVVQRKTMKSDKKNQKLNFFFEYTVMWRLKIETGKGT